MGKQKSLVQQVRACTRCPALVQSRTQPVVGEGPVPCDILFVGEAPGRVEDKIGVPFGGTAGTILETSSRIAGLQRKVDYHILNVLKCRPKGNRNPATAELEKCAPFLTQQIQTIKPKVIVALGKYAQAYFLQRNPTKIGVVKNMGKVLQLKNYYVIMSCPPRFTSRGANILRAFRVHLSLAASIQRGALPACTALDAF